MVTWFPYFILPKQVLCLWIHHSLLKQQFSKWMVCLFLANASKWSWRGETAKVKRTSTNRTSSIRIRNTLININFHLDPALPDGIKTTMQTLAIGHTELTFASTCMVRSWSHCKFVTQIIFWKTRSCIFLHGSSLRPSMRLFPFIQDLWIVMEFNA